MKLFSIVAIVGTILTGNRNVTEQVIPEVEQTVVDFEVKKTSEQETVLSYEDVLFDYYSDALNYKSSLGSSFVSFQEFSDTYYSGSLDIQSYTEGWKYVDTDNYQGYYFNKPKARIAKSSSSSETASYILDCYNYEITPIEVFKAEPKYKEKNLYSNLLVGDIIYETKTKFWNAGHTAMITDLSKPSEAYGNYIETIEAVPDSVQHGYLDDERITRYGVKILRVLDNQYFVNNAVYFMEKQLGKPYSLDILRSNSDINSSEWYCSELVWAAYYYAGIDICTINGMGHGEEGNTGGPLPYSLYASDYTYEIGLNSPFVLMSIIGKSGFKWNIRLTNINSFPKTVKYNEKMCNFDDCTNWKNLHNLVSVEIGEHSYKDVTINENWFATSVVCGWESNNKNYVTYADGLNATNRKMMVRNAIL